MVKKFGRVVLWVLVIMVLGLLLLVFNPVFVVGNPDSTNTEDACVFRKDIGDFFNPGDEEAPLDYPVLKWQDE